MKTILNIIKIVVTLSIIIMFVLYLLGYRYMFVFTESMRPTINTQDLIVTKPVKFEELKEEDIVSINVYGSNDVRLTHRIIKIDKENKLIYTKGDNNPTEDKNPTEYKDVLGKVIFIAKGIGSIIVFFKTPVGIICLGGLLILVVLLDLKKKR